VGKIQTFEQFLTTQGVEVPLLGFLASFLMTAVLTYLLGLIYVRYGKTLSNRRLFARNFMMIACTTMLIITVVKSSLALSLGLVGALSIVRFRAAIKEPEELAYLFLNIAIGLGFGANQWKITIVGFLLMYLIIAVRDRGKVREEEKNLLLTISTKGAKKTKLEDVVKILEDNCVQVALKRFDENEDLMEASFIVEFDDFKKWSHCKTLMQEADESVKISLLDSTGILS